MGRCAGGRVGERVSVQMGEGAMGKWANEQVGKWASG